MPRPPRVWLAAGAAICALLFGCREGPRGPPLRLGILVWPPYELFFVARERGLVPDGVLDLVEYRSPGDVTRAFQNGSLDAVLITADFALRLAELDPETRVVLVVDVSAGADVILARPGIESVAGLRGRTVGVENSSLGLYVLHRALEQAGAAIDEIELVSTDYPELAAGWREGTLDAVVVYEPERSRLLAEGAVEIFDSSRIPGEIVDVLVVRTDTIAERAGDLQVVVDGWLAARELWFRDPGSVAGIMARREALDEGQLQAAMERIELPDREANRRLLGDGAGSLRAPLERLAVVMGEMGFLQELVDVRSLLSDRFVGGEGEPRE
ncbi:MAG TPA: ABC transporter substrate-binding protein [Thermoanaerobaculia bacterium]|nr:ABC transporter substrate-binding protein [Thermoanaerobaculia bacterium]